MTVEAQVTIKGSKASVWAATTDFANFVQLLSGVEKIEVVDKPATGLVGLKWKETRMLFGKEATVEKQITEAKENEYYTTRAEQDGFVFITTNRLSGSDGSVTLTGIHETQPLGFAAKLKALPMVFFKGVIKKAILQDLNDIKAVVRRAATPRYLPHLFDLFAGKCSDRSTLDELRRMFDDVNSWPQAHNLFTRIRRKTLEVGEHGDARARCQYLFEEVCAKTLYNLSGSQAPFDADSPDWIVPTALSLARQLKIPEGEIAEIVAG